LPLLCLAAVAGIVFGDVRSGDAASVSGVVKMANQPISGAAVTLLAANSGKAIQFGSGTTDSGGNFQVTFQDPPGGIAYLMVDGAGTNSPIKLIAVLSNGFPPNIVINEVTTVAAAFSMAQFVDTSGNISGASPGLNNAGAAATTLADITTGKTSSLLSSGVNSPARLNTLANILSDCAPSSSPSQCN
jgi:hypothetical protein